MLSAKRSEMNKILKIFKRSTENDYEYGNPAEEYESYEWTTSASHIFAKHLYNERFTTTPVESDEEATTPQLHIFGKHFHGFRTTTTYFDSQGK